MTSSLYIGVSLRWDYRKREVNCSIPGYYPAILERFNHPLPSKLQYSSYPASQVLYGSTIQYTTNDESPKLDAKNIKLVQSIVGSILYGARLIDNTVLVAINEIGSQQAHSTTNTLNLCSWLLDYIATYPNPSITFKRSNMILYIASDSSYLSVAKSRSRVGGYHFLGNTPNPNIPLSS